VLYNSAARELVVDWPDPRDCCRVLSGIAVCTGPDRAPDRHSNRDADPLTHPPYTDSHTDFHTHAYAHPHR